MRLATLIISLILSLVVFFQSCAAAVGGGIGSEFAETAAEKTEADNLSGAAGFGILGGLLWIVGAGLVISKPKASMWIYGAAALVLVGAGAGGYSDAFIWAVASVIFAVMSWRGIEEKAEKDEQERARYQADIATAAAAQQSATAPSQTSTPPPS